MKKPMAIVLAVLFAFGFVGGLFAFGMGMTRLVLLLRFHAVVFLTLAVVVLVCGLGFVFWRSYKWLRDD